MATHNNGNFPTHLPVYDGKNYDQWIMKVIFRWPRFSCVVNEGVPALARNTTNCKQRWEENKYYIRHV